MGDVLRRAKWDSWGRTGARDVQILSTELPRRFVPLESRPGNAVEV
jgi:hypothetical protein